MCPEENCACGFRVLHHGYGLSLVGLLGDRARVSLWTQVSAHNEIGRKLAKYPKSPGARDSRNDRLKRPTAGAHWVWHGVCTVLPHEPFLPLFLRVVSRPFCYSPISSEPTSSAIVGPGPGSRSSPGGRRER